MKITAYLIIALLYLINLIVGAGWDIHPQFYSFLLSIPLFLILFSGKGIPSPQTTKKSGFILTIFGLSFASILGVTPWNLPPTLAGIFVFTVIFLASLKYFDLKSERKLMNLLLIFSATLFAIIDICKFKIVYLRAPNPHIMNGFYLLIIPLAIYELIKHKNQKMKYPLLASLLLILISFLLTQSIWGTAVLILSLILTLSIHFKLKVPKVAYFIPLLLIVIVLLSGYDITERLDWLGAGIKIISKRPLFGFGPGSRAQILPLFTEAKSLSIYIHSYFIQIGAETGLISLLGIIILLWGILKELFSGDEERKVAGISLISVLVYNFLEYNLSVPLVYLTFALISGAYLSANFSLSVFKNKILAMLSIVMLTPLLYYFTAHYLSALVFSAGRHEILHSKDRIRAEELYKSSLEIYPFPPSEYALAALYFNEGNNSQAEIIIQQSQSANLIDKTTKRSGTKEILSTGLIQFGIDPLELLNQD